MESERIYDDYGRAGGELGGLVAFSLVLGGAAKAVSYVVIQDLKYDPIDNTKAACEQGEFEGQSCSADVLDERYTAAESYADNKSNDLAVVFGFLPVVVLAGIYARAFTRGHGAHARKNRPKKPPPPDNVGPEYKGPIIS